VAADDRPLADQLVDLLLSGPAGLVLDPRPGFPGVRPKSLDQIEAQVRTAKLIGQFAVRAGWRRLGEQVDLPPDGTVPAELGGSVALNGPDGPAPDAPVGATAPDASGGATAPDASGGATAPDASGGATAPARRRAGSAPRRSTGPTAGRSETIAVRVLDEAPAPEVDALAIVAYDELAASQVVSRLEALTAPELDAVRRYEEAHRHRRTILAKVAQLQAHS
jgi:hypothetical protein